MYGSHKKHSAGARNVKARAKRALLLPSFFIFATLNYGESDGNNIFYLWDAKGWVSGF